MMRIVVRNPRTVRAQRRARYLVITMKGFQFVEEWYNAKHIPAHFTRLYQLILRLIWMKGTMTFSLARRLGYNLEVLKLASSKGYVKIDNRPSRPPEVIQNKVVEMIGQPPKLIYA